MATEILDSSIRVKKLGQCHQVTWAAFHLFGAKMSTELKDYLLKAKEKDSISAYKFLIGLSRLDGDKKIFEDIAVEYAVQFGESPPSWYEGHTPKRAAIGPLEVIVESFSVDTIIEVTVKMENPRPLVLHLSTVKKIDLAGIDLFNESLYSRIQRGEKTSLINGENLIADLFGKLKSMQGKTPPKSLWDFCFNYLKLNGLKDEFEKASRDYTKLGGELVHWKNLAEPLQTEKRKAFDGYVGDEELLTLTEKSATDFLATELGRKCAMTKTINVDFSRVRKGTLISAMNTNHFVKVFKQHGYSVNFVNVNEIFHEMFIAIGLDVNSIAVPSGSVS